LIAEPQKFFLSILTMLKVAKLLRNALSKPVMIQPRISLLKMIKFSTKVEANGESIEILSGSGPSSEIKGSMISLPNLKLEMLTLC